MKPSIIILLMFFLFPDVYSQSTAPGYYITRENDTIAAQIKIKKGVLGQITDDFIEEVVIVDSLKGSQKFTPADIKGYGISLKAGRYVFMSKPVNDGSIKFLYPMFIGKQSSLYKYGIFTPGYGTAFPSQKTFYTFEKADGTFLFLRNIVNKKFKTQVKEFYKDYPEAQPLIDAKLKYWLELEKDLKEILAAVNAS
jgi:hypothetical protein